VIEVVILFIVIPAIAAMAKGRGGSAWVAGGMALGGLFLIRTIVGLITSDSDALLGGVLLSYAWMGAVAAYYRFMVGVGRPHPKGIWSCPTCTYTNKAYVLSCAACQTPWQRPSDSR
jgi:hypothetical protein